MSLARNVSQDQSDGASLPNWSHASIPPWKPLSESPRPDATPRQSFCDAYMSPVLETSSVERSMSRLGRPRVNDWILSSELGTGSYSTVCLAKHRVTKQMAAVKIIRRSKLSRFQLLGQERLFFTEVAILKRLRHPNIIALLEVIDDPQEDELYLVLELAERQCIVVLDDNGVAIPDVAGCSHRCEAAIRSIARDLLAAIRYAHRCGVAQRDKKPEKFLLTIKRTDHQSDIVVASNDEDTSLFGAASDDDDLDLDASHSRVKFTTAGTLGFMAPEFLASDSHVDELDLRQLFLADVWSFGVTMYTLAVGRVPWAATSRTVLLSKIQQSNDVLPVPSDVHLSETLRHFLHSAIRLVPNDRSSMKQLAHHPFLSSSDSTESGDFQNFSFDADVDERSPTELPREPTDLSDSLTCVPKIYPSEADVRGAVSGLRSTSTGASLSTPGGVPQDSPSTIDGGLMVNVDVDTTVETTTDARSEHPTVSIISPMALSGTQCYESAQASPLHKCR
jgi:serine/threonine protein kinase